MAREGRSLSWFRGGFGGVVVRVAEGGEGELNKVSVGSW